MKPALSVVAFTVLSGAGLGALALLSLVVVGYVAGLASAPAAPGVLARIGLAALLLLAAGLLCSTLHLASPRNAWRSLARWRSSWLSREAAAALMLIPLALALVAALGLGFTSALLLCVALACVGVCWITLFCTAMIYASLKPIRQWHTYRVPVAFFVLAHASGALLLVAALRAYGSATPVFGVVAVMLLVVAAIVKLDYCAYVASDEQSLTMAQAIGVAQGVHPSPRSNTAVRSTPAPSAIATRLLDAGHSCATFLTHEFGYRLDSRQSFALRVLSWIAGFAVPVVWLIAGLPEWQGGGLAFGACLLGFGAERWLFFAEARHTVRLYHGDAHT